MAFAEAKINHVGGLLGQSVADILLRGYQRANKQSRLIQSSPKKDTAFQIMTGQMSASEWALQQVHLQKEAGLCTSLAVLGAALLFCADTSFRTEAENTLVVSHPQMPDYLRLHLVEQNSSLEVENKPSVRESLGMIAVGSMHMARAIGRYAGENNMALQKINVLLRFAGRYPGVPKDAEILSADKNKVTIRITDKPAKKGGWGEKDQPAVTHTETRVKFKGHYNYQEGEVKKVSAKPW